MHTTLAKVFATLVAVPMLAAAQVAPAAPTAPAAPRAAKPVPAPKPAKWHALEPELHDMHFKLDKMRFAMDEDMRFELDKVRADAELMKADALAMVHSIDMDAIKASAMEAATLARIDAEHIRASVADAMWHLPAHVVEPMPPMAPLPPLPPMPPLAVSAAKGFQGFDKLENARPPAPWAHEDPADSLYRVAREALNRGEYRRAAQVFNEVTRKYPQSRYAQDCAYWEAFSRYRIGTTEELRQALRILEGKGDGVALQAEQLARYNRSESVDIPALRTRVLGNLAARGDRDAAEQLKREASQSGGCDREEVSVRAEALNALSQMDLNAAMPTVRKVLARRDECTVELRRRALYIVGRNPGTDATAIMLDVAKNDPDNGIRHEAMRWLPRVAGDAAVPQLEEILRTSSDEQTQRAAISALGAIDSDVARRAVRAIIERNDAAERIRYEAIISLSREREGRLISNDEAAYIRSLYSKMPSPRLKEAVLTSISRVSTPENEQFLLSIARNVNETPQLRASALQRLGRMESVKVADIAKLYEVADSRSMREQILSALSQRKENEAVDKMIEIAKRDTDPQIRRYAVNLLSRSNNERAKQYFQSLFDQ